MTGLAPAPGVGRRVEGRRVLRLGAVPYLNVAPIVYGLVGDEGFALERDVPARVAERLRAGEIDLGTVPSIEYAVEDGRYAIVPGIAIGSRGAVRSVCLFHRGPLEAIRRVAVDTASRTSVALLRILLRERLGRDPEYVPAAAPIDGMLQGADAALAIGDPALYYDGAADCLDLGLEWQRLTGLPFVYAFWAGRPGVVDAGGVARLQASLREGLLAISAIAASYNGPAGAPPAARAAENEAYLRTSMSYGLGEAEVSGLLEFYRRAAALGLILRVPPLCFQGPAGGAR